ncbi:hypothetical protein AKO1_012294 [Acrasis kona]|uniref:Fanconi anemia group M protein n=1 Tax=Acrasis kona TaxID=1008807 RepID=A0AAW2Z9W0_9EUKA
MSKKPLKLVPAPSTSTSTNNNKTVEEKIYEQALKESSFDDLDDLDFDDVDFEELDRITDMELNNNKFFEEDSMPHVDREATRTWYYPSNMKVRQYQLKIVESSLYSNTMVCLPTGLGKTLIASVLMYNYFRWYPTGKIIFVAPTCTLVAQQIHACYNIMGIPMKDTTLLTGKVAPEKRTSIWKRKRVFFCTPQVVNNDLIDGICPGGEVVLVIVDEAHKASGNYPYCGIITELTKLCKNHFRVLALTATPGGDLAKVQEVITNLNISLMEVRDEKDPDVSMYLQDKTIIVREVKITGEVAELRELIFQLMQDSVDKLNKAKVLYNKDLRSITKGQMYYVKKQIQSAKNFFLLAEAVAVEDLCALNDSLLVYGIQDYVDALEKYYDDARSGKTKSKKRANIIKTQTFKQLFERSRLYLKQGIIHPKMLELEKVVLEHFEKNRKAGTLHQTRIIIFASFRSIVDNIVQRLSRHSGTIKVMKFVGQSNNSKTKGLANRDQKRVIKEFQSGNYNTLVSTSVGEEGLDIGEVDLIVCYDSVASPTRMIQRMGRTGRKRQGEAVIVVTEGQEANKYAKSCKRVASLFETIKHIQQPDSGCQFFKGNNRMVPDDITPKLEMMQMNVDPVDNHHFSSPNKLSNARDKLINPSELDYLYRQYNIKSLLNVVVDHPDALRRLVAKLQSDTSWIDYQNATSPIYKVKHSAGSTIISKLFRSVADSDYDDIQVDVDPTHPFIDENDIQYDDPVSEKFEVEDIDESLNFGGFEVMDDDLIAPWPDDEEISPFGGLEVSFPDDMDLNENVNTDVNIEKDHVGENVNIDEENVVNRNIDSEIDIIDRSISSPLPLSPDVGTAYCDEENVVETFNEKLEHASPVYVPVVKKKETYSIKSLPNIECRMPSEMFNAIVNGENSDEVPPLLRHLILQSIRNKECTPKRNIEEVYTQDFRIVGSTKRLRLSENL